MGRPRPPPCFLNSTPPTLTGLIWHMIITSIILDVPREPSSGYERWAERKQGEGLSHDRFPVRRWNIQLCKSEQS